MHAILVHGWKGGPEYGWFPWLRRELEAHGIAVDALKLPNPIFPDRRAWIEKVKAAITGPDTILIGHSLGCPTILLALQEYTGEPLRQVVLVAGFSRPFPFLFVNEWFGKEKIDIPLVKTKAKSWAVLHAQKDPLVPFSEGEWLAHQLDVPLIEVQSHQGHLAPEEGAFEVPEILKAIVLEADSLSGSMRI